ncbi:MAG: hypothetical protein Q9186_005192 [Xanthomendoza sp. 1 TL-2023]
MSSNFAVEPAPPGIHSNFEDPPSLYREILATVVLCYVLTTLLTAARIITKKSMSTWMLEDHALMIAWVLNIAYDSLVLAQAQYGIGRHAWDIPGTNVVRIAQLSWAILILYCPTIFFAKAALLLQLSRIFTPTKVGTVYWTIQALIWVNLAFMLSIFLAVMFECIPTRKIWDSTYVGGQCIDRVALILAYSSVNILSDALIFFLPIWAIAHLHIALDRKLGLVAVFATGLLACIASVCRLAYSIPLLRGTDSTFVTAQVAMWTYVDSSLRLETYIYMANGFVLIAWLSSRL